MVGQVEESDGVRRLAHAAAHMRRLVHVLRDQPGKVEDDIDEDEAAVNAVDDDARFDRAFLCTGCGALGDREISPCSCTHATTIPVIVWNARKGEAFRRCMACGRHSTTEVTQ